VSQRSSHSGVDPHISVSVTMQVVN